MKAEKQIIIKEEDWKASKYRTVEWEQSVDIIRWEHDYVKKEYIIDYNKCGKQYNTPQTQKK